MSITTVSEIKKIDDRNIRLAAVSSLDASGLTPSDLQGLIELLADPYWPVREAASKKLIATGPSVCESLVSAISGPNEDVRFWSSQILAAIADDRAIKLLIDSFAFYDENDINTYSARALIKVGEKAAAPLTEALDSPNDLIRLYSLYCLGELKCTAAVAKIRRLLTTDANFAIRRNAAVALGKIGERSAINDLIAAISDKSWYVRIAATEALGRFKFMSDSESSAAAGNEKVPADMHERITSSIFASLSDTEARVRETGARVLSELGATAVQRQLIRLLLNSDSEGEKIVAARNLDGSYPQEALPALASVLAAQCSPELKKEVLKALGRIESDEAVKIITAFLSDENTDIAVTAVTAAFASRSRAACDALPALLEDPREEVRCAAIAALGRNDYFDLRHYLYAALEDSSGAVRRQAMLSLYSLLGEEALSEIINLIEDPDEFVAVEAVNLAAKTKNPDSIPALARVIEKGSNRIAYMSFQTLAAIGPPAEYAVLKYLSSDNRDVCYWAICALEKTATQNCILPLLDALKKHSGQQEIVEKALEVLAQFDFELDEKFFIEVLKGLKSSHSKAIELLGKSRKAETAFEIIPYLRSDDRETRFRAAAALGRLGNCDDAVIGALVESLKDRYWPVRKAAAESLAALGETAARRLKDELNRADANADIVYWALRALAENAERSSIPIFKKYIDAPGADIKKIIIKGLGKIGDAEAISLLMPMLKSADAQLRFHAVKSLRNCSDPQLLGPLMEMMNDEYENVRSFAAIALGNFKTPAAVEALKRALNDQSHWVVKYAKESLSKLLK